MSKNKAVIFQLYNKAMNGNLAAVKLILQCIQQSMIDLDSASKRVYKTTIIMREEERSKIFIPSPQPKTIGALLERKHEICSANFANREIFGEDKFPLIYEDEPRYEMDWHIFNHNMKKEYQETGHMACDVDNPEIPSLLKLQKLSFC